MKFYCFKCGKEIEKLKDTKTLWMQCVNDDCGEMYYLEITKKTIALNLYKTCGDEYKLEV